MKKTLSIRRSLILNQIMMIALLSGAILLITTFASRSAIRNLSSKIINQTIAQAESRLFGFFVPVANELVGMKSLGEKKMISMDEPDRLRDQFKTIMLQYPQITSILLADEFGRDFMLLRQKDKWLNRQMGLNNTARITRWDNNDEIISEETVTIDYDPRKRPWYMNADEKWETISKSMIQKDYFKLMSWTKPYIFLTTKEPGITVSIRYHTPDGSKYIMGFDILLKDIQVFTDGLEILNHGQFVILTTEDIVRIVSFSLKRYTGDTQISKSITLETIEATGIPLIQDTMNELRNRLGDEIENPFRFKSEKKTWWGASKRFSIADDQKLRMCVIVPESDLLGSLEETRHWILVITAGVLLIGLVRAIAIANRYSRPIESLVTSSRRISKGDFEPGKPIVSNIYEILKLSEAHEMMRNGLKTLMKLEDDIRIAHEIQQKTFPVSLPIIPGFEIAGWNMSADETGGDTYDVIGYEVDPETNAVHLYDDEAEKAILLLGDATGHGLGPALSVTQIRAMLRMGVHINPDIPLLLEHINEQLHADLPSGRFITAWLAQLDARTKMLNYFSAGQGPLLYLNAEKNTVDVLKADTYPLGITDSINLTHINRLEMSPGDIFAVISDGFFEAANSEYELFGTDRVIELLIRDQKKSALDIIDIIRNEVNEFTKNAAASDDRTIIIIKRK